MEDLKNQVIVLEAYIKLLQKEKYTKDNYENIKFQKERLNKIKEDIKNKKKF